MEKLNTLKRDLEKIIEFRTKGAIPRSKSQWYNEGEKNTKCFLNLESRHFKQGTISHLKINDNDFVTSDAAIFSECKIATDYFSLLDERNNTLTLLKNGSLNHMQFVTLTLSSSLESVLEIILFF